MARKHKQICPLRSCIEPSASTPQSGQDRQPGASGRWASAPSLTQSTFTYRLDSRCRRYHVRRHEAFASAITGRFMVGSEYCFASLFLYVASDTWIEPDLAEIPGASGDAGLVWFVSAGPFLAAATLLNLIVLAWCSVLYVRREAWPVSWLAWLMVPIWLVTLWFDNAHHGS